MHKQPRILIEINNRIVTKLVVNNPNIEVIVVDLDMYGKDPKGAEMVTIEGITDISDTFSDVYKDAPNKANRLIYNQLKIIEDKTEEKKDEQVSV